ncbi:MAG: acyl-ACP--UDP-N-acetylglucosamine O-acyltransferase [Deltaproteobacteria bacterium]|nr:acyl-ACP--UDP-N-acetylglucosamine O-acyltransferase [Deltaproteobacteria bacterium]
MRANIHPTAIVDSQARLATSVTVGAYSTIGPNVIIGEGCEIRSHVVIEGHTTLGEENVIFQFASIGSAPQDLKYKGESSTLEMGSRNIIREHVTLNPGTQGGHMRTVIGDDNVFLVGSHVAHDCSVGNNNILSNGVALAGHVSIGNRIVLGGMVGVHQFCRIGDMAIAGAGSMLAHDLPPYCIGQGDRCHLRGVNIVGLRRGGVSEDEILIIKKVYRHLFSKMGRLEEKINNLPPELSGHLRIRPLIEFIQSSERTICTPLKHLSE